jgi:Fe-S-cluster containining protein
MTEHDNPCLTCPATCCSLKGESGLRLSRGEFETHFKSFEKDLLVREEGGMVVISSKEGLVCPHLGEKGCRIYPDRPIDCRLCPCQMLPVYETRKKVKIMLYLLPECVEDKSFNYLEAEARALVEAFGKEAFRNKKITIQVFEDKLVPKVKNKLETLFMKFLFKAGLV